MHRMVAISLMPALWSAAVQAAEPKPPLDQQLEVVRGLICAGPADYTTLFDPQFLAKVPPASLTPVFKEYCDKGGPVQTVLKVKEEGPFAGEYRFLGTRAVFPVRIGINPAPPHLVHTLWFGLPAPALATLDEAIARLKELPGTTSLALYQLGGKEPKLVQSHNPDTPLAIGSAFKLYVLGALIDDVERGARRWEDVIALSDARRSFPSGVVHNWPAATPITLATLAAEMISISDNTATDELLFALGRLRVEAMLAPMGNRHAGKNQPFLATREMFMLKTTTPEAAKRLAAYRGLDARGRRAYLDAELARLGRDAFRSLDVSKPVAIDDVEWFASASDLGRAMDWLRAKTAPDRTALGRKLLGINRGLSWSDERWDYVGYKGGSEPGVLAQAWLIKKKGGGWYALAAGWNNPQAPLDEQRFFELMQGIILLLELQP